MTRRHGHRRNAPAILAVPALLAIAALGGLIAGLLGDGWYDVLAWIGIGLPVGVVAFCSGWRKPQL